MSFILRGMAKRQNNETVIPLGVVFMVMGLIILGTAVAIFVVVSREPAPMVARIQAATVPTAAAQAATDDIALLPETPLEEGANTLVNLEDVAQAYIKGQPERIVIPDAAVDAPVSGVGLVQVQNNGQIYYQWQVPDEYRAGWHNTSAPLGKAGNTVLNGHHNINGEVFRDLINLEEGAEVIVYDREHAYTYVVSDIELLPERDQPLAVRQENARWIGPTDDERLTLVTCWPYEDNSHRVVIIAYPAEAEAISNASPEH